MDYFWEIRFLAKCYMKRLETASLALPDGNKIWIRKFLHTIFVAFADEARLTPSLCFQPSC